MKRCICVLLVSTVLFGGCMNRNRVANTFVQVEKALAVAPDSAMRLLKDIPAKSLGNQAMRARYALLYIDAAERAQLNENTDSLLRIAWRYYRKHPQEMQNRCRTLYYMAHSKLRQGDKPGALRLFLEAEENNDSLDNPRDRGMLYLSGRVEFRKGLPLLSGSPRTVPALGRHAPSDRSIARHDGLRSAYARLRANAP